MAAGRSRALQHGWMKTVPNARGARHRSGNISQNRLKPLYFNGR